MNMKELQLVKPEGDPGQGIEKTMSIIERKNV
jgi:hypothetical protein